MVRSWIRKNSERTEFLRIQLQRTGWFQPAGRLKLVSRGIFLDPQHKFACWVIDLSTMLRYRKRQVVLR